MRTHTPQIPHGCRTPALMLLAVSMCTLCFFKVLNLNMDTESFSEHRQAKDPFADSSKLTTNVLQYRGSRDYKPSSRRQLTTRLSSTATGTYQVSTAVPLSSTEDRTPPAKKTTNAVVLAVATSSQRSTTNHTDSISHSGSLNVAFFGLVKDSARVLQQRIAELTIIACMPDVRASLYVVEGGSTDVTRTMLDAFHHRSIDNPKAAKATMFCKDKTYAFHDFRVIDQPVSFTSFSAKSTHSSAHPGDKNSSSARVFEEKGKLKSGQLNRGETYVALDTRVLFMQVLRNFQRQWMAQVHKKHVFDAVVLIDFDLEKFPTPESVRAAVGSVGSPQDTSAAFSALCAFGQTAYKLRMWTGMSYYDSFATVLLNGTFAYYDGENPNEKNKLKWITDDISHHTSPVYPVQSCFGGVTVYHPEVYFYPDCDYTSHEQGGKYSLGHGHQCEHVTLHLCLRRKLTSFRIGVAKKMVTHWLPEDQKPPPGHDTSKIW